MSFSVPRQRLELEVTAAIGEGFPMGEVCGRPLVVALSGTGVAAGRPLVRRRIATATRRAHRSFSGVRNAAEVPLVADLEGWRAAGVPVFVCVSQGEAEPAGRARVPRLRPGRRPVPCDAGLASRRIFAVGVASMVDALRALAPALGVAPGRVRTNH